jgi:hypothetical protein
MFTELGRAVLQVINHFLQSGFDRGEEPPTACPTPEPEPQRQQDEPEQPHESPESPEDKPSTRWRDHVTHSRPESWNRDLQRWLPQEQEQERDTPEHEHDQGRDR